MESLLAFGMLKQPQAQQNDLAPILHENMQLSLPPVHEMISALSPLLRKRGWRAATN